VETLQARTLGQETDDVARAMQVHAQPQLTRNREVVHGGEVMGRGQVLAERARIAVRETEPGLRDVPYHDLRAPARVGVGGLHAGEPLARRFQEPRLDETAEAGLRRELHEPRQQPHPDEAREPGEKDGAGRHGAV
jgi:hypothetical protein